MPIHLTSITRSQNTSVVCAYRQSHCNTALAGMSLEDVANMTESERIEKVPINGQRKRLVAFHEHTHTAQQPAANLRPLTAAQVMALKALSPMADEGHEASASAGTSSPRVKYNSTSSLYIDSTITKPCTDEMIFSVSVVLHDRISEGEQATAEAEAKGETLPRFKLGTKDLRPVVNAPEPSPQP